jgi:hypothetical protein
MLPVSRRIGRIRMRLMAKKISVAVNSEISIDSRKTLRE